MAFLSSFEILAERLVPANILPPTAENPFALQGYFVQISLATGSSALFNVIFQETTDFQQGLGQSALQAQIIAADGTVSIYPNFFASTGRGFLSQKLGAGQTAIFGVQCIPGLTKADLRLPQNGTGWRGTVRIEGQSPGQLIATPTQRLVYYNGTDITKANVIDAVVYPVPTFSGGTSI